MKRSKGTQKTKETSAMEIYAFNTAEISSQPFLSPPSFVSPLTSTSASASTLVEV